MFSTSSSSDYVSTIRQRSQHPNNKALVCSQKHSYRSAKPIISSDHINLWSHLITSLYNYMNTLQATKSIHWSFILNWNESTLQNNFWHLTAVLHYICKKSRTPCANLSKVSPNIFKPELRTINSSWKKCHFHYTNVECNFHFTFCSRPVQLLQSKPIFRNKIPL